MKDNTVVNVKRDEIHCSNCGALQGSFTGGSQGFIRCTRCGRNLRFLVRDEEIIVTCQRKKGI